MAGPLFQTGDIVRCVIPQEPLKRNHIYTVAGIEDASEPVAPTPLPCAFLHLVGLEQLRFFASRFALVARKPANDDAPRAAAETIARMAQVMRERVAAEGACTIDDLARAGFTAAQIFECADEARGRAGILPPEVA